ncbi:MAG: hypothetical protein E7076_08175 [Bacteroidales bacterium]|nr:hypothetical protein [Bacteroidales bacterium]MDD6357781.1 hypothetical protein [Bacteroidales bacterium]
MKHIIISLGLLLLISCSQNNVLGRYYSCHKEKDVSHYIELLSDSTFKYVYIKNNIYQEHTGTWQLFYRNGSPEDIHFSSWVEFDEYILKWKEERQSSLQDPLIRHNQIIFDIDNYDLNFKKK